MIRHGCSRWRYGVGVGKTGHREGSEDGRREDGKTGDQKSGKWLAVVGDGTEGRLSGLGGGESAAD